MDERVEGSSLDVKNGNYLIFVNIFYKKELAKNNPDIVYQTIILFLKSTHTVDKQKRF
jgi:hypothetical protein